MIADNKHFNHISTWFIHQASIISIVKIEVCRVQLDFCVN